MEVTNDQSLRAEFSLALSFIFSTHGMRFKASEYVKRSVEYHKELKDRVGMAGDYCNISCAFSETSKEEAIKNLDGALKILEVFEQENDYHHPLIESVTSRISYLTGQG